MPPVDETRESKKLPQNSATKMENYCAGGLLEKERTKFTRFQRVVSLVRSPSPPVILPRPFVMTEFCFSESAAGIGAGWGFSGLCVRVFALR